MEKLTEATNHISKVFTDSESVQNALVISIQEKIKIIKE